MSHARVRPALPDDVLLLATLQRSWWQEAYGDLLPEDVLSIDPQMLADRWAAQLAGAWALIAEENTHPVGFALADPRVAEGVGHIELLGVLPRWARRGHGGRLLVACAERLHGAGAETGTLWAPERDEAMASFLAGAGWEPAGVRRVLDTGAGRLVEIQYAGTLHLELDDDSRGDHGGGHDHGHDH